MAFVLSKKEVIVLNLSCLDLGAGVRYGCGFKGRILHNLNFKIWGYRSMYEYRGGYSPKNN